MSRFYASISGQAKTVATRGSGHSDIHGHIRGWNVGIRIYGYVNVDGKDEFAVYLTGGSHGRKIEKVIGIFIEKDLGD